MIDIFLNHISRRITVSENKKRHTDKMIYFLVIIIKTTFISLEKDTGLINVSQENKLRINGSNNILVPGMNTTC